MNEPSVFKPNAALELRLRDELKEVESSSLFARAPIMRKLLRYLVESKINNPDSPPKAYEVAVYGLGREADFDIQSESYPRVQIGRLRKLLKNYYEVNAKNEQLSIPIGSYSIQFETFNYEAFENEEDTLFINKAATVPKRTLGLGAYLGVIAALFVVIIIGIAWTLLAKTDATDDKLSAPIAFNEAKPPKLYLKAANGNASPPASLMNFLEVSFAGAENISLIDSRKNSNTRNVEDPNSYELFVSQAAGTPESQVSFKLMSMSNDQLLWTQTIDLPSSPSEYPKNIGTVVSQVGGLYGAIANDQYARLSEQPAIGYGCLLKVQNFNATRSSDMIVPVLECIERSLEIDPYDSQMLSAASFMAYVNDYKIGKKADPVAAAQYAQRALIRGRNRSATNFAIARIAFFSGSCARGKSYAEKAVALNPYEPILLEQVSASLFGCKDKNAEKYARRAIELDPQGSIIAQNVLVFVLIEKGEKQEALQVAESIIPSSGINGPYYDMAMLLAYAENGRVEDARLAWRNLSNRYGDIRSNSPKKLLTGLLNNKTLVKRAMDLLEKTKVIETIEEG